MPILESPQTSGSARPGWPAMSIAQAHALLTGPGSMLEVAECEIRGAPTRIWKNAPPSLQHILKSSRGYGDRVFLVFEDERVTFEAFFRATASFARELQAAGVTKGDRVAIIQRNVPEWPVAFFAAASLGAIVTPMNAWWTGAELEYGLIDSGAKVAIVDAERLERLLATPPSCTALEKLYVTRQAAGSSPIHATSLATPLEAILGRPNQWIDLPDLPLPDVSLGPDDNATIFYTSGTTDRPKGALATHRNIITNIMNLACVAARNYLRRGETPPPPDAPAKPRVTLLTIPFFHVSGCFAALIPSLFLGGKLVLMHKWEPVKALELIEREKVTLSGGVPTIVWQLIEHPARQNYDISSLETISYGGAPAAPELVRRIADTFPSSLPSNGWGMTETSATAVSHSAEDYMNRPDSCGPAVPVADIKIMNPDGDRELPIGAIGELWFKGPQVVAGYWNKPEATAKTFVDGWVKTGDLARIDDEGFCYIVDRAKDMLIRGGENIYCVEVENVLFEHPAVLDVAVVGLPHRILGEEPAAVIVPRPGVETSEADIRNYVIQRLAAFKAPVKVLFLDAPLPRNVNGKVQKNELKQILMSQT